MRAAAARFALALVIFLGVLGGGRSARAAGGKDPREQTARAFYAIGKYREAIDVFAQMYAEKPHANYIFNIGRCYQNLPDPDKAIASFRDYLRRAPKLSAPEKQEIEGYIREMEDLRKQRGAAATALADILPQDSKDPKDKAEPPKAPVAATATPTAAGAAGAPAGTPTPATTAPAGATPAAKAAPADPAGLQIATWRGRAEALWQEQAGKADDARISKIEAMLGKAKADDPRLAEYQLFLGTLYAAKHFKNRLKAMGARKLDASGEAAAPAPAPDDEIKTLDAEASGAFLKAVSAYAAASKIQSFPRADEALYQLAFILQANNMEARASSVLSRLVRTMPDSKYGKQVAAVTPPAKEAK